MKHNRIIMSIGFAFCLILLCFALFSPNLKAKKSDFMITNGTLYSYSGKSSSVTIPSGVKEISSYAFHGNKMIKTVTIPKSVKKIGDGAFGNCTNLKTVTMHSGITTIESYAFNNCKNLSTITIPKTVTRIGADAFEKTAWLKKQKTGYVVAGNGVLIKYTGKKTTITLPSNVRYLADSVFFKSNVVKVTLSNKITTIGISAFSESKKLKEVKIPAAVTTIMDNAFSNCKSLKKVVIPNESKLLTIGNQTFSDCSSLKTLNLPDSVSEIGYSAFERCGLTSFTIPSGVITLNDMLFRNCSKLSKVTVPDSVASIQYGVFSGCSSLIDISLPTTLQYVGLDSFAETGITANPVDNFLIADSHVLLQYVGTESKVSVPDSITVIAENAFQGNESLSELTLGENVTYINTRAFYGCEYLKKVTLNRYLESIGKSAFMDCSSLKSIVFPESLKSLDHYAFYNCRALSDVQFANTKITYGIDTLVNTKWFDNFDGDCVVTNDGTFLGYKGNDSELELPDSINTLAPSSLEYAKLKKITIPRTIKKLPFSLFYYSNVEEVVIEDGVEEIGERCFEDCYDLTTIHVPDSVKTFGNNIFSSEEPLETTHTFICAKDSAAAKYAKSHGINVLYR